MDILDNSDIYFLNNIVYAEIYSNKIKVEYFIYYIYMGIFNDNTNKKSNEVVIQEKLSSKPTTYITSLNNVYNLETWTNTMFNFNYTSKFPNVSVAIHFKSQLQFGNNASSANVYFRWKVVCVKNNNIYYPGLSQKIKHPQNSFTIANFGIQGERVADALCSVSNTSIFITKKEESSYVFTLQCKVTDSGFIYFNVPWIRANSPNCGYVTSSMEIVELQNSYVTSTSGILIYTEFLRN